MLVPISTAPCNYDVSIISADVLSTFCKYNIPRRWVANDLCDCLYIFNPLTCVELGLFLKIRLSQRKKW